MAGGGLTLTENPMFAGAAAGLPTNSASTYSVAAPRVIPDLCSMGH
jgi:hypothetical protein